MGNEPAPSLRDLGAGFLFNRKNLTRGERRKRRKRKIPNPVPPAGVKTGYIVDGCGEGTTGLHLWGTINLDGVGVSHDCSRANL
jgi:hypothetical protein